MESKNLGLDYTINMSFFYNFNYLSKIKLEINIFG